MAEEKVAMIARQVEDKGLYTKLRLEHGLESPDVVCPLAQVTVNEKS